RRRNPSVAMSEGMPTVPRPNSPGFAQIKAIVDRLIAGRDDDMPLVHGEGFGWKDKSAFVKAVVMPFGDEPSFRLIDPALIGVGRATETFLYQALTTGVSGYPRMPFGGPYATDEELELIRDWIDTGTPD
ncbi:MAG TPA: hypothetical protein VF090_02445, partial [Methyloceanibacter sp.]